MFTVPAKFRIAVVNSVQLEPEHTGADDVGRETRQNVAHVHPVGVARHFFVNIAHHLYAARFDLVVHQLELARCERRAQFAPDGLPLRVSHEKQVVRQRVRVEVRVYTAIGEVREVFDQYPVDDFRISDHQVRRPHLKVTAILVARQLSVNTLVRVHRMIDSQRDSQVIAEQRHRADVRDFQFFPFAKSRSTIVVNNRKQDQAQDNEVHTVVSIREHRERGKHD